jgi:hypothetical protein
VIGTKSNNAIDEFYIIIFDEYTKAGSDEKPLLDLIMTGFFLNSRIRESIRRF